MLEAGQHSNYLMVAQYRELEEAERLGSGVSAGTPRYSAGSAREGPGAHSMSLSAQGSAASRGSLLAPHTAMQVGCPQVLPIMSGSPDPRFP